MNKSLKAAWGFLGHYKYVITIVLGVFFIGFVGENSVLQRIKYDAQIGELNDEITKYNERNEQATEQLRELRRNPRAIERIARERYFMKTDDEDIYVFQSDVAQQQAQSDDEMKNIE